MSVADRIDFHGLPAVRWRSRDGASAIATLQGAHLVSWVPAGGEENLFVSERSPFETGRAIRGGIPVCFPQFADRGPLPQHGFARTQAWRFVGGREDDGGSSVSFTLEETPATLASWPHPFQLELTATVGGTRLALQLRVVNTGEGAFGFTGALHTYLRADAATVTVRGLRGLRFLTRGESVTGIESRELVTAAEPIDRVYFAAPRATRVEDGGRALHIEQRGFTDTVVWNPGAERCAQMADMAPDGWRRMVCVEAAAIEPGVSLAPRQEWTGQQKVVVVGR